MRETVTGFDIRRDADGQIMFVIDEHDIDTGWYGCEIFHPTAGELKELHALIGAFLEEMT